MVHMLRYPAVLFLAAAICALAQDEKPAPTLPDLQTAAQASYMKGDYEAARQSLRAAWDLAQQLPPEDPIRYDVLKRLSTVRSTVGEFADADNFLQLAISWREQTLGPDDPKIPDDVLISVGYARGQKDFARALAIMGRVMRLHMQANVKTGATREDARNSVTIADDFSRIAQIQMEMSKPDEAAISLQMAIDIRTRLGGPLEPSLIYDLDRLGTIQITKRAYSDAEATYRHALIIRETLFGKVHADLIATVDGLAYALFGQGKFDDAEPMYQRLLDLWLASTKDPVHPMVAIAYEKIAVFYAKQKKWDQAREAESKANAIRAAILGDGLSGEATQRLEEGKMAEAVPIYQRALKVLDPPNPIYDELRATLDGMDKELEKTLKKPASPPPSRVATKK